jgi:hypothetical protein
MEHIRLVYTACKAVEQISFAIKDFESDLGLPLRGAIAKVPEVDEMLRYEKKAMDRLHEINHEPIGYDEHTASVDELKEIYPDVSINRLSFEPRIVKVRTATHYDPKNQKVLDDILSYQKGVEDLILKLKIQMGILHECANCGSELDSYGHCLDDKSQDCTYKQPPIKS